MNELQKIVSEIKYRTGQTLDEISEVIGYARPYFNKAINHGDNDVIKKVLIDKYGKKLIDYWNEDKSVVSEPEPEFGHTLTMQSLNNITKSNLNISESNKSIARSNEELVAMLKSKMAATDLEKKTFSEMVATVLALREYIVGLSAAVDFQAPENALKALGKMAKDNLRKIGKDNIHKDGK